MSKRRDLKLSEYGISRYRYRELYYWCLQYPKWGITNRRRKIVEDALHRALKAIYNGSRMDSLFVDILSSVTREDITYDHLYMRHSIPCSRSTYRRIRRLFFFLLDQEKRD